MNTNIHTTPAPGRPWAPSPARGAILLSAVLAFTPSAQADPARLIDIRSAALSDGILTSWPNAGTLGGAFKPVSDPEVSAGGSIQPATVGTTAGARSVGFVAIAGDVYHNPGSSMQLKDGSDNLITLGAGNTGNNPWTVSTWAYKVHRGFATFEDFYALLDWGRPHSAGIYTGNFASFNWGGGL
ncbi:MAG: hypothetical protein NTW21_30920 [Verrucomicrobia bacterium]|nr:hypothetical protein [Verrucomicrobiota bacterium]